MKANWEQFRSATKNMCDDIPSNNSDINVSFAAFQKKLLKAAKETIPRGFRKKYIPKWDTVCDELCSQLEEAQTLEEKQLSSNRLIEHLNSKRKQQWVATVENVDMKHSSRKAWSTLNKLTGRTHISPNPNSISPNAVASCLLSNGKFKDPNKPFTREVNRQLKEAWNAPSTDQNMCNDFTSKEIDTAIKTLKAGKAPGVDNLHPEFFLHMDESCTEWLRRFLTTCLKMKSIPKSWKLAKVVAVLKPKTPANAASSYRPISLLCVPYKLYERLIYNRIQPIVESVLPTEQAGFRQRRSSQDQVVRLTEDIECCFDNKLKAGVVLVDLSAAYDTVWLRGLTLKLLRTLPSKDMVGVIMSMISQRRFYVQIGRKNSRNRTLINGVPQGSVLAPLLFNLYTYDIPQTDSTKYIFADDIALMTCHKDFSEIERVLSQDIDILRDYLTNWRLKLNMTKTVSSVFHLANRKAHYELNILSYGERLKYDHTPKYLGVTLDRTLSYKNHLIDVSSKISKRTNLLKSLASNKWGADFSTLRISALALCYSAAEYCSPVWSQSRHCNRINTSLNECLRLISGCIKATPTDLLPVLSGIVPADIRRDRNILELYKRSLSEDHMLHHIQSHPLLNNRLKSRVPLSARMHSLANENNSTSPKTWADTTWKRRWNKLDYRLKEFIPQPSSKPPGHDLNRRNWVLLNRIRSGYGRYASFMHRVGLSDSPNCICGEIQTPQHILTCQRIGIRGDIRTVDDDFRLWLNENIILDI